jgi:hypothetical protein
MLERVGTVIEVEVAELSPNASIIVIQIVYGPEAA